MSLVSRSDAPRVLITGVDGFTGQHLSRELIERGYRVFGTTHAPVGEGREGVYTVDICDRAELARIIRDVRPDFVAHLAAISFVAHGDADAIYRVNIVGTRNLLEGVSTSGYEPTSVLLASSANVYGNSSFEVIEETVPLSPVNDYAVSKLAMEHMASLWADRLPIIVARPFNYTGFGQNEKFLIPKIVSHFRRREAVIELGNIDVERDFSDVRRLTDTYAKLLSSGLKRGTFNVCSGKAHSLKDIILLMENIAGYQIEVRTNPAFVRANEVKRLLGSCEKLISVVGPLMEIPLRETLEWMYSS